MRRTQDQRLEGVVSFRNLFAAPGEKPVAQVMHKEVISASETMGQEAVAQLIARHDFHALPVLDAEGRMKGIVTIDDIVDVVREAATEDIQKLGGMEALDTPYMQTRLRAMIKKRAGWLSALFLGEMLTASAMGHYEEEIAKAVVLALFVPLIISSGGNSGSQATTLIIRAMALGEITVKDWWRIIRRELTAGLALGVILATIGAIRILVWQGIFHTCCEHYVEVAATVAVSLVVVVTWGTLAGSMLPFVIRRFGFDPGERFCALRCHAGRRLGARHLLQRCAGHPAGELTVSKRHVTFLLALSCLTLVPRTALGIRPFVTDDARVVGNKLAQLETWMLADRVVLEHYVLAAVGPTEWLELTLGLMQGGVHSGQNRGYSITGPIVQGKALLSPASNNSWPGLAVAAGVLPPVGHGPFVPPGWGGFTFLAVTESLYDEWLLLHANLGVAMGDDGAVSTDLGFENSSSGRIRKLMTAGFGLQGRVVAGLHGVAEIYYGDPYDPRTNFPATQVGFRYIFNDDVQIDGTVGSTLRAVEGAAGHAQAEQWVTLGLRLVSPELW